MDDVLPNRCCKEKTERRLATAINENTKDVPLEISDLIATYLPWHYCEDCKQNLLKRTNVLRVIIKGPAGSPYEGGAFELEIMLPDYYPFAAPKIHFVTEIYHCNISEKGLFRLNPDILHDGVRLGEPDHGGWSPAKTIPMVLKEISDLLAHPD